MGEADRSHSTGMTPHRLEALADGIFAFAMTFLVLSINMPDGAKNVNVGAFILNQGHNFWNFTLSFFLLALFWLGHSQQFHHIKRTDALTLWLNIFMLLFVVLVPFSTSLMNDYPNDLVAEVFFNSNMLALSLVLTLNWGYSYRRGLFETEINAHHLARINRRGLLMPLVSFGGLLVAFVSPGWSTLVYLLVPFFLVLPSSKQ